jgi:hypothetical protein
MDAHDVQLSMSKHGEILNTQTFNSFSDYSHDRMRTTNSNLLGWTAFVSLAVRNNSNTNLFDHARSATAAVVVNTDYRILCKTLPFSPTTFSNREPTVRLQSYKPTAVDGQTQAIRRPPC